jgi:hypothetical protein
MGEQHSRLSYGAACAIMRGCCAKGRRSGLHAGGAGVGEVSRVGSPLMLAPVRDRSEWVWQSRWRQVYFVVSSVAVAALVGLLIGGRVVLGFVVFAAAAALGGLFLAGRRRQR